VPGKPAAVFPTNIAGKVTVPAAGGISGGINKDAASQFSQSAFNQMVAQIADESVAPVPAVTAQTVKLPPKSAMDAGDQNADQLPDLSAPDWTVPIRLAETTIVPAAPISGRKEETRGPAASTNDNPVYLASVPVDVFIPVPIAPKVQLPSFAGKSSPEPKSVSAVAVSSAEEPAAISLQPRPILEVKIHLNQTINETSVPQKQTTPVVSSLIVAPELSSIVTSTAAPVLARVAGPVATPLVTPVAIPVVRPVGTSAPAVAGAKSAPGTAPAVVPNGTAPAVTQPAAYDQAPQQNPERGAPDPEAADKGLVVEVSAHKTSRTASTQEAPATLPQQTPNVGPVQLPAQNSTVLPVAPAVAPLPTTAGETKPEPQTSGTPLREEAAIDPPKAQQPIRSLALEFAPEGAGDIKVRLSERAGDVHISLHGTDPALAGRVREGVGDLVGSLSKAGYDAEAWTPGQGRQSQREQPDQRKPARGASGASAEEFSGILQQPIQEIS
jgi:hypothetical protein